MVVYMFPCYSPHLSHPLLPPTLCPQVCTLCLCLHCCLFLCLQTPSQPNHGGASGLSGQDAHLTWGWPLALPAEAPAPRMHQKLQSQWGGTGLGVKSWPLTLPSLNCAEEQGQDADSGMRLLGAFAWTLLHPPAWNVHWPHGVAPRLEEINPFVGLPLLHVLIPGLELHL